MRALRVMLRDAKTCQKIMDFNDAEVFSVCESMSLIVCPPFFIIFGKFGNGKMKKNPRNPKVWQNSEQKGEIFYIVHFRQF